MKTNLICLALLLCSAGCQGQDVTSPPKATKCTSTPCGNTATGEDPQEVRYKEAVKEIEQQNATGSDSDRWKETIYSDSSKPEKLQREVIRASGLRMRLDPQKGHLTFESPAFKDTFEFANPAGTKNVTCPYYDVTVVDASPGHVLLKRNCPIFPLGGNRIAMSSDYYLYDAKTSVMRSIWGAVASTKGEKFPAAKPTPSVKRLSDGYRFDWAGVRPNDPENKMVKISNAYKWFRDKQSGKLELLCADLDAPKGEGLENSMCSMGALPLVASAKK